MTDFIMNFENAVPDELCDKIIRRLDDLLSSDNKSMSYMEGSEQNAGYANRQDYSYNFIHSDPELVAEVHSYLSDCVHKYCEEHPAYGMVPCISRIMKVQKTKPKGGFHRWHCEQGYSDHADLRTLTWTLYLNDIPEGEGETEFIELGLKVQPKKSMISLFPASWTHTHRGNPVYTTTKYIATGWYYAMK